MPDTYKYQVLHLQSGLKQSQGGISSPTEHWRNVLSCSFILMRYSRQRNQSIYVVLLALNKSSKIRKVTRSVRIADKCIPRTDAANSLALLDVHWLPEGYFLLGFHSPCWLVCNYRSGCSVGWNDGYISCMARSRGGLSAGADRTQCVLVWLLEGLTMTDPISHAVEFSVHQFSYFKRHTRHRILSSHRHSVNLVDRTSRSWRLTSPTCFSQDP